MPKFKAYKEFVRTIDARLINGDTLTFSYKPALYNRALQKRFGAKKNPDGSVTPAMSDAEFLKEVLVSWDFEDEKGKPVPINAEVLETEMNLLDLSNITSAIIQDVVPNAEAKESTPDNSPSP